MASTTLSHAATLSQPLVGPGRACARNSETTVTKIEWTDEQWNPWVGCNAIAPECDHRYAASFASRGLWPWHKSTAAKGEWTGIIERAPPTTWAKPHTWSRGTKVFASSMTDFWHEGVPMPWLAEALDVIEATPHLIYQTLTKRPGNVARKLATLNRRLPANVWIGATIGHPQSLPLLKPLRRIEASVRFLSVEPLLAPMPGLDLDGIEWVICGGESGPKARPCRQRRRHDAAERRRGDAPDSGRADPVGRAGERDQVPSRGAGDGTCRSCRRERLLALSAEWGAARLPISFQGGPGQIMGSSVPR